MPIVTKNIEFDEESYQLWQLAHAVLFRTQPGGGRTSDKRVLKFLLQLVPWDKLVEVLEERTPGDRTPQPATSALPPTKLKEKK